MFGCKDSEKFCACNYFHSFQEFRPSVDGCHAWVFRHVVGLPTLYLRHARDHVPLSSKPSTVCSDQCIKIRSLCIQPCKRCLLFFPCDGQSFGFLKTEASVRMGSLYVELLQCAFYPVRYPLNIGYHGKSSRARMVVFWAGPWLAFSINL